MKIFTLMVPSKQDGHSNNVQFTQMCFTLPSGTTSSMFTLSGNGTDATAMAVLEYVSLYSYAGSSHEAGIEYASTRRTNSNTAWNNINDIVVEQSGNNSSIRPTLFWDNGVLKITSGSSVQITGTLRLTTRRFTVTRNFQRWIIRFTAQDNTCTDCTGWMYPLRQSILPDPTIISLPDM